MKSSWSRLFHIENHLISGSLALICINKILCYFISKKSSLLNFQSTSTITSILLETYQLYLSKEVQQRVKVSWLPTLWSDKGWSPWILSVLKVNILQITALLTSSPSLLFFFQKNVIGFRFPTVDTASMLDYFGNEYHSS